MAVLGSSQSETPPVNESDITIVACRGSGPGGQHRNKTDSAIQATHKPTGITVRCESERSQHQNRRLAIQWIEAKVADVAQARGLETMNGERRQQIGSGMRGDKVRTVRYMDGIVTNNLNGKKTSLDKYLDGDFGKLFDGQEAKTV